MPNHRFKLSLRTIHNWIGLVAGLLIALISVTGSVIVFRDDIRNAQLPKSIVVSDPLRRASLDDVARQVQLARPGAGIRRVRLPQDPADPYVLQIESGGKQERLASDASTGRVLGTLENGWIDWTIDLHRNLLYGRPGRSAVGAIGVTLFILAATGLLLWMIGARKWRTWISVRSRGSSRRFHFELHRVTGLWSYGFLALVSFTGVGVSYPAAFRQALHWLTGDPATAESPKVAKSSTRQMKPLDEYLRIGKSAMPDGVPVELRLPQPGRGPVELRLFRTGDLSSSGNRVYLDPATATVLSVSRAADQPVGARVFSAFSPIHYGEFGGFGIKILWALLGLTPAVLFVTGLVAWWRPTKRETPAEVREEALVV
jgi:uncharacterized iron-regulated membrane protein